MAQIKVIDANTGQFVTVDTENPSGNIYVNDASTGRLVLIPLGGGTYSGGGGDMYKADYDTDNNGIVDNSEQLEGHAASYFQTAVSGLVTVSGVPTADHLVTWADSDTVKDAGTFLNSMWTQVINESGASFSNFTGISGTWASDGTVIKQTNTSNARFRAKYNTATPAIATLMQADIQMKDSGTDHQGGLILGFDGIGTGGIIVHFKSGQNQLAEQRDGITEDWVVTLTVNTNTWYTLKVLCVGRDVSMWVDNVFIGTSRTTSFGNAPYLGLVAYQAEVWYRNIKAWVLTLPI